MIGSVIFCYGTRPESLKISPVVRECEAHGVQCEVVCTNQSPDLLDPSILPMSFYLDVASIEWSLYGLCAVQGDTRTAFQCAVAAFEAGVPVVHIEAGVRSGHLSSPFPEEGYRRMISQIATYHACTTYQNAINLSGSILGMAAERTDGTILKSCPQPPYNIRVTGSPIVESVRERVTDCSSGGTELILVTLHRRENRGHFADILRGIGDARNGRLVWWAAHPNGWAEEEWKERCTTFAPRPPLQADAFALAVSTARVVVTDSGGVQEESSVLGVPCVVARTVTDRPESLVSEHGGNCVLGGNTREGIARAIGEALALDRSQFRTDIYGDGTASRQLAEWIKEIVG
jgi:UDP-N-acetylglucosamine 2-epimerase (non-hydrolysing)